VRALVLVSLALALVFVPGGAAAFQVDGTTCSVHFRTRSANLDCAVGIPGGTVTPAGSPAITVDVRGGEQAAFTYDSLGRLVGADVGTQHTAYLYGDGGRLLAASGPGGTINYTYDSLARLVGAGGAAFGYGDRGLVRAVEPDGSSVDYSYDRAGNLVTVDAGTSTARFLYGRRHRVASADVDGSTTTYEYDRAGEPVSKVADGETTHFSYDARRELVRGVGADTVAYSYNHAGSLIAAADSAGVTHFRYGRLGRLLAITGPGGAVTSFGYNHDGFLTLLVPRVGQEVVVDFLEGDPDMPIVVGVNYRDDLGETFALNLRGRLITCGTCP
jgi:YD repeat-containing protein